MRRTSGRERGELPDAVERPGRARADDASARHVRSLPLMRQRAVALGQPRHRLVPRARPSCRASAPGRRAGCALTKRAVLNCSALAVVAMTIAGTRDRLEPELAVSPRASGDRRRRARTRRHTAGTWRTHSDETARAVRAARPFEIGGEPRGVAAERVVARAAARGESRSSSSEAPTSARPLRCGARARASRPRRTAADTRDRSDALRAEHAREVGAVELVVAGVVEVAEPARGRVERLDADRRLDVLGVIGRARPCREGRTHRLPRCEGRPSASCSSMWSMSGRQTFSSNTSTP